ncbi:flagellar hook-length control protein FliK [Leifsonia sp. YAF41]|uniref:flagellar hook-length control protein FliK n=1 Tax=Leifsonia sp. YAF41 TaxID=3233086 RepID=UPI003F9770F8
MTMTLPTTLAPAPSPAGRTSSSASSGSAAGADGFAAALRDTAINDSLGGAPEPTQAQDPTARDGDDSAQGGGTADDTTQGGDLPLQGASAVSGSVVSALLEGILGGGSLTGDPAPASTAVSGAAAPTSSAAQALADVAAGGPTGVGAGTAALATTPAGAVEAGLAQAVSADAGAAGVRTAPKAQAAASASASAANSLLTIGSSDGTGEAPADLTGSTTIASPAPVGGTVGTPSATAPVGQAPAGGSDTTTAPGTNPDSSGAGAGAGTPDGAVVAPRVESTPPTSADSTVQPIAAPTGSAPTASAPAVSAVPVAAHAAPVPLTEQVAKPLLALVGAADGEHTLTITVTPDNLGPVTVRAHVAGEHIRIELFAPSAESRDALKQILTDLRRDLASNGFGAQLDLSGKNQPDSGSDRGTGRQLPNEPASRGRQFEAEQHARRPVGGPTSMLDVLA